MPRVTFNEEHCKGCLLCLHACPKKIIAQSKRFNRLGYKVAEVSDENMSKCIGCAACAMVCPDYVIRVYREAKKTQKEDKA